MTTVGQLSVIILLSITGASASSWMQQPYANDSFNELRKYGENVTLTCNTSDNATVEYWVLPNTRVMQQGDVVSFLTLDGTASWQVSEDGRALTIVLVQQEHFGLYYCVVSASDRHHVIKRALNYRGAYYGNLWVKYKSNVIIGCGSAGSVIVAAILLVVVHTVVTNGGTRRQGSQNGLHRSSQTGTVNKTFTDSDIAGIHIVTISTLDVTNEVAQKEQRTHADNLIVNTTVL